MWDIELSYLGNVSAQLIVENHADYLADRAT